MHNSNQMNKKTTLISFFVFLLSITFVLNACSDADDDPIPSNVQINDFVWKGLNLYYYWQLDSPDLADNRFGDNPSYVFFLNGFSSPENLFEHLLVDRETDRFSVIFSDYTVLENTLQGISKNNGLDFSLNFKDETRTSIFGWVRYVLPNTDASAQNVARGTIFYAVNGVEMNAQNYQSLLSSDTYTLNLADYDDGNITPNGQSITLTKAEYSENPVYLSDVFEIGTKKIGYLVYNGFYVDYESQLNAVFTDFQAQGVTDLVLDLRYNSGGAVSTATRLASMITGQFNQQVFARQEWNQKANDFFNENNPDFLVNKFTTSLANQNAITSLQLPKLYVLTTRSSASASELIINGLTSYIDVVQIGTKTSGKNVGSITLYDSPTFGSSNRNSSHKYAMQPITFKIVNNDNFGDYQDGLIPDIEIAENLNSLGVLGDPSETLLSAAINEIVNNGRFQNQNHFSIDNNLFFKDSKDLKPFGKEMYVKF
uniref:S41 family peptidase n=3 Tax=Flavobacterium sp. TaxID=239 RepID=UPI00404A6012